MSEKTWLGETSLRLLAAARQALEDDGDRAPDLSHLVPGVDVAWDNCCEGGGQLFVRVVSISPVLPPNVSSSSACGPTYLRAQLGVGVIRCTPTIDNYGTPPTAEAMTASALEIFRDANAIQRAIQCALKEFPVMQSRGTPLSWSPLGPEGGCAGGEWLLTVGIPSCGDCD